MDNFNNNLCDIIPHWFAKLPENIEYIDYLCSEKHQSTDTINDEDWSDSQN